MLAIDVVWLFFWLFIKHFVVDYPLQGPYQYRNKGTYGHFGGILHSGLHGISTTAILLIMFPAFPTSAIFLGFIDFTIHYHVDWMKVWVNRLMNWTPTTSEQFWWLLGFDQLLHTLTYVGFVVYYINIV